MSAMPPTRLHRDEVTIDLDLTRRLVTRRLVAARLPDLAGLRLARVASGGTENAVFRLGDDHALRMPLTTGAVGGLLKEVRWLPALSAHLTLEVPEVVATGEPACGYPFPRALVRWLEGHDALDFGAMATGDPAYDLTPAWHVLDAERRTVFLDLVGFDEAAARRARGLVVSSSVIALPYYLHTNPSMVATARRGIEQVLADLG